MNNTTINSIEDVELAMSLVKKRIKLREEDLGLRLKQLPEETFKATTGMFLPAFINNKIAWRTWNIIQDTIGLLSPFKTDKASLWKDIAKQVGFVSLFKGAIGLFKK
jgi:hypothetical protein